MAGEIENDIKVDREFQYCIPVRRISSPEDMEIFTASTTKALILGFVKKLNNSVVGKTNDAECHVSDLVDSICKGLLSAVESILEKHPASDQVSSRFGKPEFKDFYDEVQNEAANMIKTHLLAVRSFPSEAIPEIATYLTESWGNRQRIDYGSGHELSFISFLLCLDQLGLITEEDYTAVVLKVFLGYMTLVRKVQTMYWLEPAGSHGVWGLDDYHFLPFMFGSAQLSTHKHLRPISIHDEEVVDMFYKKYMYFGCIKFINQTKTASLRWHSPLIDDISGVKKWSKVNEGMIKMYEAEVLGKLPIMQHYLFGSLIPAPQGISPPPPAGSDIPHVHNHWADCCGIKVPSAIAASALQGSDSRQRLIPFD